MSDITRIDAKAFKEAGFLQEANRQWFHPHGLALELTLITADEEAPLTRVSLPPAALATLKGLLGNEQQRAGESRPLADFSSEDLKALGDAIDKAVTYCVGDCYFSGCWDYRSDPEGIYYGSWDDESAEKAARVLEERSKHYLHRARMFGWQFGKGVVADDEEMRSNWDIEPVGFVPTDEG